MNIENQFSLTISFSLRLSLYAIMLQSTLSVAKRHLVYGYWMCVFYWSIVSDMMLFGIVLNTVAGIYVPTLYLIISSLFCSYCSCSLPIDSVAVVYPIHFVTKKFSAVFSTDYSKVACIRGCTLNICMFV